MNFQFPRHFSLSSTHKSLIASFPLSKIHTSAWLIASPPSCFSYNIISPNCIPGTSRVDEPFLFWVIFCTLLHTTVSPPPKKKKKQQNPGKQYECGTCWQVDEKIFNTGREKKADQPSFFFLVPFVLKLCLLVCF